MYGGDKKVCMVANKKKYVYIHTYMVANKKVCMVANRKACMVAGLMLKWEQ